MRHAQRRRNALPHAVGFKTRLHRRNQAAELKHYPGDLAGYLRQRVENYGVNNVDWITDEVVDLLSQMLQVVPSRRKPAKEVSTVSPIDA